MPEATNFAKPPVNLDGLSDKSPSLRWRAFRRARSPSSFGPAIGHNDIKVEEFIQSLRAVLPLTCMSRRVLRGVCLFNVQRTALLEVGVFPRQGTHFFVKPCIVHMCMHLEKRPHHPAITFPSHDSCLSGLNRCEYIRYVILVIRKLTVVHSEYGVSSTTPWLRRIPWLR